MRPYQEQYLALLHRMSDISIPSADTLSPEEFVAESAKNAALAGQMVEEGTQLLRQSWTTSWPPAGRRRRTWPPSPPP